MSTESRRVRRYFMAQARYHCPDWWKRGINPRGSGDPATRFRDKAAGVRDVLSQRRADESRALEVLDHLLAVCPDAILSFNAWYVLHHAREMGILDDGFMPVRDCAATGRRGIS